jgi:fatty-acyl-CoA synthase
MENFAGTLDYQAERRPDKVVLTLGDRTLTNVQLYDRVNALAQSLRDMGVGRGDIVAILLYNCPEFLELVYAVNRLGAAFMPLNYRLAPAEWQYILGHAEAKVIVADPEFTPAVTEFTAALPALQHTVVMGEADGWTPYDELVGRNPGARVPVVDVEGGELQRLMYTSGTTARPKGVCISHRNLAWKNLGYLVQFGFTDAEVTAVTGPLYHVGALDMGGLATLHAGGSLVLQRKFEPLGLIDVIAEHRATSVWLAPAMVNGLLQHRDALAAADLSSLRLVLSGGEKMPESRLATVLDLFPGLWFADAYGLTETVSSDTFMPYDRMREKIGSVGRPLPHNQVRVADDDGRSVPPGQVGEVLIRGPKVFSAYWRDPEATARTFVDGWLRTGDMGRMDEDGFLYIEDRKKDMIVSGGENIATPEVERVLWEHPDVVEAAVVGHPDERWGEVPHAFVVLRAGATVTDDELRAFCQERLARFKAPRYFTTVSTLPRNPTGKVLKKDLRSTVTSGE